MGNRKKKVGRGPLTPKRRPVAVSAEVLLNMFAVEIEAAGSIDRALQIGVIGMDGANRRLLASLVPKTRGGTLEGPEVERDWRELVSSLLKDRDYDLEELRRRYQQLAQSNSP